MNRLGIDPELLEWLLSLVTSETSTHEVREAAKSLYDAIEFPESVI